MDRDPRKYLIQAGEQKSQYAAPLIDGQPRTKASKGIKILFDFPRKYLTQGRVWNSRVLRCRVTKEANLCYFRSRFLASRELQWNRNTFA